MALMAHNSSQLTQLIRLNQLTQLTKEGKMFKICTAWIGNTLLSMILFLKMAKNCFKESLGWFLQIRQLMFGAGLAD